MTPTSLAELLKPKNRLPPEVAVRYVRAILEALTAIHEKGLVYGDLKPADVLLVSGARVRLLEDAESLSEGPAVGSPGTPRIMSPEVLMGERATAASDIWCVGVFLYRMLMGHLPFPATNLHDLFRATLEGKPGDLDPNLPPVLSQFTLRCLRPEPGDRPANAGEALAEL